MTKIYFVRHAMSDISIKDDRTRPLTESGMQASLKVTEFLSDKNITRAYSSPYKRSIDTIKNFTDSVKLEITLVEDFRERKSDKVWVEDFNSFAKSQWSDFNFKMQDGENLNEVQSRNIAALEKVLNENQGTNVIVGSHGTALSTIINYYDNTFGYEEFERIRPLMPLVVCFTFDGRKLLKIEEFIV